MTTDEKVRQRIVRMLQDEVVPKYKRKKVNSKSPIHYNPNYVARMYLQMKEEVQWE